MVNINMHVFKHPKFYEEFRQRSKRCQKELRKLRNKEARRVQGCLPTNELHNSDQAISGVVFSSRAAGTRAPDPGQSAKLQAPSVKPQAPEASSDKRQAPSSKRQA